MEQLDEKVLNAILKIKHFEDTAPPEQWMPIGWTWDEVGVAQATINKLITMDLVKRTFSSNKTKAHKLTEKAKQHCIMHDSIQTQPVNDSIQDNIADLEKLTEHMFDDVIGYDDLKELMRESILTDKPIHILLVGPPALSKSLLIYDIDKALASRAMWIVGSATSKAGLWDSVALHKPRTLLIDELDKMSPVDTAALLSLMETGRLVRTKVKRQLDIKLDTWVIGTANTTHKMAPELLSRFKVYQIREYNSVQFREVVTKSLQIHEDLSEETASQIALRLVGKTKDVRDAVRVARLSKRVGVERAVELLIQ